MNMVVHEPTIKKTTNPIWLLVLMVTDSQQGNNKWGENPKEIVA